jgi:3-oxoadipate enol-lactonase
MARIHVHDLQIGYNERGAGDTLIFLHGVGSDKSVWDRQLEYFAPRWRAIALDYPGYGESSLPERGLDRASLAAYVLGALDALNVDTAHVVGLSMGGVIALELALRVPARLRSLVLADTFAWHPDARAIMERTRAALATVTMREFAEQRVDLLLAPGATPDLRAEVIETMARIDKRTYAWASAAVWTPDYRADLVRIELPALVLVGEHDRPTPPALSEALQAGLPSARLQLIDGAGHIANIDQPTAFNTAIEDFLDDL